MLAFGPGSSGTVERMIHVGTSGWQYKDWRGVLYEEGLPQDLWLERYAQVFSAVEVNNSFYRLPERATFDGWRRRTPAGSTFVVKASRYLTHIKRLRDAEVGVKLLWERAAQATGGTSSVDGRIGSPPSPPAMCGRSSTTTTRAQPFGTRSSFAKCWRSRTRR